MTRPEVFDDTPAKKLLTKGLLLIERELTRFTYMDKLDPHELRALNDIVKTLVSVDRNERQSELEEDLSKIKDEDLEELYKKAAVHLKEK